jgi:ADP-heptose:LPS heptosyltransferase
LSNTHYQDIFSFNARIKFIGVDLKKEHESVLQLIKEVKKTTGKTEFSFIYDLHDVIRTKILRTYLKCQGKKVRVFKKNRSTKKKIISKKIPLKQLSHTCERYKKCISKDFPKLNDEDFQINLPVPKKLEKIIGLAPYAAHESKIWPVKNYNHIFEHFKEFKFLLFVFGKKELELAKKTFLAFPNCEIIAQHLSFSEQLALINKLPVFLTMDSANMHLGSLTNSKVISLWGPTHPFLGFGPLFNNENIIQLNQEELPCRPCSVYGKIKSKDKDCAKKSMVKITSKKVINQIEKCLNN